MSSLSQQTSTPTTTSNIPREQHGALFAVINKARMLNGWATRTAQELDPTIRTWAETFANYNIPLSAYHELYQRAFEVRQSRLRDGDKVPQMDATLLVSQWTGAFGLRAELRQRAEDAARSLPANAESVCQLCNGSGWKTMERNGYKGVTQCDHNNEIW